MKGRAEVGAIGLFDNDDIDGTGECGGIDFIVELAKVGNKFANIVHFRGY